jgi:hypothetical protein
MKPSVTTLSAAALFAIAVAAFALAPRFQRFDEVRDIIVSFTRSGAIASDLPNATSWNQWIRGCDREIRARIDRGVEDSISNLILYGASFTALPRIEGAEEALTPSGGLSEGARARVRAFASALPCRTENERLRFATGFLVRRGIASAAIQSVLEANLARFAAEQHAYRDTLESASKKADSGELLFTRSTLFHDRGLSVDTSLLPNFALEDTLRAMIRKGALSPGAIRRIAVIGPGLDFTDKRDGYDYYPLQTIQPFAILEAVARLGLGAAEKLDVTTFDLNPAVLEHVRGLTHRARAGLPYTIQLPRYTHADWKPEALSYWQHFGDILGSPVPAVAVPAALKRDVVARAVAIQPRYAARIAAADLDVVAQTMDIAPGAGFDLVVATNVLVYYDLFRQALAKAAIARMMNPGGVLLVNHALPKEPIGPLEYLGRRSVSYSSAGAYGDDVVAYRRR